MFLFYNLSEAQRGDLGYLPMIAVNFWQNQNEYYTASVSKATPSLLFQSFCFSWTPVILVKITCTTKGGKHPYNQGLKPKSDWDL